MADTPKIKILIGEDDTFTYLEKFDDEILNEALQVLWDDGCLDFFGMKGFYYVDFKIESGFEEPHGNDIALEFDTFTKVERYNGDPSPQQAFDGYKKRNAAIIVGWKGCTGLFGWAELEKGIYALLEYASIISQSGFWGHGNTNEALVRALDEHKHDADEVLEFWKTGKHKND